MRTPLLRHPSAFVPMLISLAALAMVLVYASLYGVTRQPDERAPARIFQFLMLLQIPIITFFAIRWLPHSPAQAIRVLLIQAAAWLAPIAAIVYLER